MAMRLHLKKWCYQNSERTSINATIVEGCLKRDGLFYEFKVPAATH